MTNVISPLPCQTSTQDLSSCDVIVAGAGPVGLFLACELASAGCSVLLLEKLPDPDSPLKRIPFGLRGLSAPSIEALYRRSLLGELEIHKKIKNPHKTTKPEGPQRQRGHFAGIPFLEGNIDATQWPYQLPSSTELSLISEVGELESVLARRAQNLGVTILRGCAVSDFHQTADAVVVQSETRSFSAKWLVGCDGSRSLVRKTCGIEFPGTEPEFTGYSTQLEIADPQKLSAGRNLTSTGMYFQSQPGYLVMVEFDGGAGHRAEPVTMERMQGALRRVSNTDVTINALHAGTTWTDRARQAATYRRGRVFLAGDAAHIHAPLGGQGLNLGLGDAMNLGWKLAATVRGEAPEGLLDSYQAERHPLGLQILGWSRAQVAIMRPDAASRALNAILRDLIATRDGATYFAGSVWGVRNHYDLQGSHPLVGHSVPNFHLQAGSTIGELMRAGQGILLDFTNNATLKAHAGVYCGLMYISGQAEEQFALTAVLIRPDGIVAWAYENENDTQEMSELRQATAVWFARLTSSTAAQ